MKPENKAGISPFVFENLWTEVDRLQKDNPSLIVFLRNDQVTIMLRNVRFQDKEMETMVAEVIKNIIVHQQNEENRNKGIGTETNEANGTEKADGPNGTNENKEE